MKNSTRLAIALGSALAGCTGLKAPGLYPAAPPVSGTKTSLDLAKASLPEAPRGVASLPGSSALAARFAASASLYGNLDKVSGVRIATLDELQGEGLFTSHPFTGNLTVEVISATGSFTKNSPDGERSLQFTRYTCLYNAEGELIAEFLR